MMADPYRTAPPRPFQLNVKTLAIALHCLRYTEARLRDVNIEGISDEDVYEAIEQLTKALGGCLMTFTPVQT